MQSKDSKSTIMVPISSNASASNTLAQYKIACHTTIYYLWPENHMDNA